MTSRFTKYLPALALLPALLASFGCDSAVPNVKGHNFVIPDRSPSRAVQALDAPSTDDTEGGSGNAQQAFCLNGVQGEQTFNPDGSFVTEFDCAAGGGIAKIRNVGTQDPVTGDGAYDQITTLEDGTEKIWHFTIDISDDFVTQSYTGVSDDGAESYSGTYTAVDVNHSQIHETWNLAEGTYVTDGLSGTDGSFDGLQTFDDPSTEANPDWTNDEVVNADQTFSQDVHFNGEGFVSDYTYAVAGDGAVDYSFVTDLNETQASPDYSGAYNYNADGSGQGSYTQNLDDGSTVQVQDIINADQSVVESWQFDDVSTDQAVDQEGTMSWHLDGSADGNVISHIVGGGEQRCEVHVSSDGNQTIDNCDS